MSEYEVECRGLIEKVGGSGAESLARLQRISTAALQAVSEWGAERRVIDMWRNLA